MRVAVGDKIRITKGSYIGKEYVVKDVRNNNAVVILDNVAYGHFSHTSYKIVTPCNVSAPSKSKIGDTIIVTDRQSTSEGQEFIVDKIFPSGVWTAIRDKLNVRSYHFPHSAYVVVQPAASISATSVSCPDCHGIRQIELFTSIVKCKKCCGEN